MVDLGDEAEVPHRRVREHIVERVDRADRDVRLPQPRDDVVLLQRPDALLEDRDQDRPVGDPLSVVGEARVIGEVVEIEGGAHALE